MARIRLLGVHRWLGLVLGPLLLLQIVTGAFMVASDLPHGPPLRQSMADFVSTANRIETALPGTRLTRLYAPANGRPAFAELAGGSGGQTYAELDPAGTAPVRSGPLWHFPFRAAVQMHYRLASGTGGMVVVFLIGSALALAALFGLLVWWPGWRHLRQSLKSAGNLPARHRLRQRHRTIGALVAIPALFSAATGVTLIVPDIMAAQVPPPAAAMPAPARASLSKLEAALNAAQSRFPDARLRDVRFPLADRIDINFHAPDRGPRAVHVVSVRLSDGGVIKTVPARENPALWMKVLPLHTGEFIGWAGALLLLAEAAALAFLVWAGTRMWLGGRRKS